MASVKNVTALTRNYIVSHPSIRDALLKGLINYSALSRLICAEYRLDAFDAVLAACRRYRTRVKVPRSQEATVRNLIQTSRMLIRNKIMVAIIDKPRDFKKFHELRALVRRGRGDFNLVEGEEVVTVITSEDFEKDVRLFFRNKIIKLEKNLVQVSLIFNRKIETTPGVVSYIYSLLAEHGINILEEMSCWTDLLLVIEERALPHTLEVLGSRGLK
ncbi:MAG: hypothetical protein D6719_10975 [Candidatus Dadabacteria bacterium]|nr:MAG: hypothetical protein D6719_10975 [Candidatus Dadabacteria bacterium]